ncbi:ABC transporter permease [Kribbella sp. NPDC051587]|uniref:ABC transporter permease n=1 Tax=Kribbella sp. NPDC051587 TaxID=3364119 RepID=UPI0037BD6659
MKPTVRIARLYVLLLSLSVRRQLAFKADFFVELAGTLLGLASSLAAIFAVFSRTNNLGGYDSTEAVVLLSTYQIISGLRQALVEPNVRYNGTQVRDGTFDSILTQPAPSIFLATLASASPLALMQSAAGVSLLIPSVMRLATPPTPVQILLWLALVAAAAVVMWATRSILAAAAFWSLGFSLDETYDAAWQIGRYPTSLLQNPLRFLFTYIIPVAFIATVPTGVLTGKLHLFWGPIGILCAIAAGTLAIRFWRYSLRHYASATS